MTSQYRHRRSSDPTKAFTQLEPGEIAVNTANRQIAAGDAAAGVVGNPLPLLPLRYFDSRAKYAAGDLVYYQDVVYRSIGVSGPGAFTPPQWTMLVGAIDPQYVAKAGDTMTGLLTLSGNPSTGLHAAPKQYVDTQDALKVAKAGDTMTGLLVLPATPPTLATHATNKDYVDNALANKASVISSDTPPAGVIDNTLWFESDTGLLYVRYNDGNSIQWVIACPQPDTSLFVQRTGDTMSGALVLPAPAPTLPAHASNKAYVDATAKLFSNKNYIVNGAMQISQEFGTGGTVTSATYPVDAFGLIFGGTTGIVGSSQIVVVAPSGSPNRLRVSANAVDATVAAGDFVIVRQAIEGLRVADLRIGSISVKTVTLQFGVKAPAGTYCIALHNSASNRGYTAEYSIAAGEANTDVIKSVTVKLDTTGTWLADNNAGLIIDWCLMAGTTFQTPPNTWVAGNFFGSANQFNFMGTAGNIFELFDVSLTEGTTAPPFTVPDYASELAACKRYWWRSVSQIADISTISQTTIFPVEMRASPTITGGAAGFTVAATTTYSAHVYQTARSYVTLSYNSRL